MVGMGSELLPLSLLATPRGLLETPRASSVPAGKA